MDGLATGVGLVASITMFILAAMSGSWLAAIPLAALAGASAGFRLYNVHPASVFLGDTGSLLLGFLLSCMALLSSYRHAAVGLAIPLIICALPISDTLLAVLRRWSRRMPISSADREHIHHRLLAFGFSQTQAVGILYILAIFSGIVAIILSLCNSSMQLIVGSFLGLALIIGLRIMKWADLQLVSNRIQRDVKRTRQKSDHWELINKTCNEIRYVRSEHYLKKLLIKVFEGLDLDRVVLVTSIPSILKPGRNFAFKWYRGDDDLIKPYENAWSAHLTIKKKDGIIGRIHVIQNADRAELPADISACLKTICEAVADRLIPHKAIVPDLESRAEIRDISADGKQAKPRILIVDDEKEICEIIQKSLSGNGWEVSAFVNPQDAISSIQRHFYHLAFVDLVMPKMNGIEVIKQLLIENPTLRIIAMSGKVNLDNMEDILNMGAVTFIAKPFDLKMVRNLVEITV